MSNDDLQQIVLGQLAARTRRHFLRDSGLGFGALAASSLGMMPNLAATEQPTDQPNPAAGADQAKPFGYTGQAKAKRVIYLHMSGGPPQLDMFDYKPKLVEYHMKPCPDEYLKKERFAFIKGHPKMLGSPHPFEQTGKTGTWITKLLPNLAKHVDELAILKAVHTTEINHAPAELLLFTGSNRPGSPAMGSWLTYGLGSENRDLPGFVVLISGGTDPTGGKSLWSSGFIPSVHQGVQCRSAGDPILFVNNPAGMSRDSRRATLDAIRELNEQEFARSNDPETKTRISQYELAFRMQMSVPEVANIAREPKAMLDLYGAKPGEASFANNCLLARRMIESGVRFVQLFDWGWDIHGTNPGDDLVTQFPRKCKDVDQAISALLTDLKERGLLDDTLVIWGGEFGRTAMNEARNGSTLLGRDHHPHCFTMWMTGAGIKPGVSFGQTDDFGYLPVADKVSIRDVQATVMKLMGFDPWQYSYKYQGLRQRLIGPKDDDAKIIETILS